MSDINSIKFSIDDFEEWSRLYREDRAEFERRRSDALNHAHNNLAERNKHRMQALQHRLDLVRERCKTPLKGAIEMHEMLCNNAINTIGQMYDCIETKTHPRRLPAKSGVVVPINTAKTS